MESIRFIELSTGFDIIDERQQTGDFFDGDSVVETIAASGDLVRVLQINIFAVNAAGQSIVNFFAISFTNDCSIWPTLREGNSAGWGVFVSPLTVINTQTHGSRGEQTTEQTHEQPNNQTKLN